MGLLGREPAGNWRGLQDHLLALALVNGIQVASKAELEISAALLALVVPGHPLEPALHAIVILP